MTNLAIILTTFLRDELLEQTVQSIVHNNTNNHLILIGDQNPNHIKEMNYNYTPNCIYIPQAYDIGLSASRNELIKVANSFKCDYVVISADSIQFTAPYNFEKVIDTMQTNCIDRMGFALANRVAWEFLLDIIPAKHFKLDLPDTFIESEIGLLTKVDICKNFFIASLDSLLDIPWDNNLKLMEHEDWSLRYKQAGYVTYVTDFIQANYIDSKSFGYKQMRDRMYGEFRIKLLKKYNLREWIYYGAGVMEYIKKEKCI